MFTARIILMLSVAIFLGGCAVTPKIHLKAGDMAMEVTSKTSFVMRVAYSPDGKGAASGDKDGTLRLWDIEAGKLIRTIKMPAIITHINYSADNKNLITDSWNGHSIFSGSNIRFWDLKTGAEIKNFPSYTNLHSSVTFSSDGKYLLFKISSDESRLLDVQSGQTVREFKSDGSAIISPDGRYVYLHETTGFKRLFDLTTGKELWNAETSKEYIISTEFSPDSKYLLESGYRTTLRLIDVSTGAEARHFDSSTIVYARSSFFPDGMSFIISGRSGSGLVGDRIDFQTWGTKTGAMVRQFRTYP